MTEEELTKQAECCVHEDVIDQVTMDMPPEETLRNCRMPVSSAERAQSDSQFALNGKLLTA